MNAVSQTDWPETVIAIPALNDNGSVALGHRHGFDNVSITIHGKTVFVETEKLLKHLAALSDCYVLPKEIKGRVVA
jgi:hypothetical protein